MLLDRSRMLLAGLAVFLPLGGTASAVTEVVTASPAAADSHACTNSISVGISPTVDEGTSPGTPAPTNLTARVGDSIVYRVTVDSVVGDCPFHSGTLRLNMPTATSTTLTFATPAMPTAVILATTLSLAPGGTTHFTSAPYVVTQADINNKTDPSLGTTPSPGNVQAYALLVGKTTKTTGRTQTATGTADYTIPVIHPETTLTKTPSVTTGAIPLQVTYTFAETNVSTKADPTTLLTRDVIKTVKLTDTNCTPAFTRSSDTTTTTLNPGATWTYTCTVTYTTTGTFTDHASASGIAGDTRPAGTPASLGKPQSESAEASVTATPATPTIMTSPTPSSAVVGSTLKDTVTLATLVNPVTGATAGRITVNLYAPTDTTCTGTPAFTTSFPATTGTGAYTSPNGFVANTAGTWHWTATYTGDKNNSTASSPCTAEPVTVTKPSVMTLTPGYWKNHLSFTPGHPTAPYTGEYLPITLGTYTVSTTSDAFDVLSNLECRTTGINCLAGQLLAAELNLANNTSTCIATVVAAADTLLTKVGYNGPRSYPTVTKSQAAMAKELASELSLYNSDNTGTC